MFGQWQCVGYRTCSEPLKDFPFPKALFRWWPVSDMSGPHIVCPDSPHA